MDREAAEGTRERRAARRAEKVAAPSETPEVALATRQLLARRMERLRGYVAEDAVASAIVDAVEDGHDTARDQADATGKPIERIYEGRRRLGRSVRRVVAEIPEDE